MPPPRNTVLSGVDPITRARSAITRALGHLDNLERGRYADDHRPLVDALDGLHGATASLLADLADIDNMVAVHLVHLGVTESELRFEDGDR